MNEPRIIGWTLGNDCPFKCSHCYSLSVRNKGQNLNKGIIDKITSELKELNINSVVLGGNEPIFTNGLNPKESLLPYIIDNLSEAEINPIIISSGFTINFLYKYKLEMLKKVKHIIISIDSPFELEHNNNRGAKLFDMAMESLRIAGELNIPKTILLVAMNWNFDEKHVEELINLCKRTNSFLRINIYKSERDHKFSPEIGQLISSFKYLLDNSNTHIVTEPMLNQIFYNQKSYPFCGLNTFRINSITPDGKIPISKCIYKHSDRFGNIVEESLPYLYNNKITESVSPSENFCNCLNPLYKPQLNYLKTYKYKITYHKDLEYFNYYICTWWGSPK